MTDDRSVEVEALRKKVEELTASVSRLQEQLSFKENCLQELLAKQSGLANRERAPEDVF